MELAKKIEQLEERIEELEKENDDLETENEELEERLEATPETKKALEMYADVANWHDGKFIPQMPSDRTLDPWEIADRALR